jgi:hypothetical protein
LDQIAFEYESQVQIPSLGYKFDKIYLIQLYFTHNLVISLEIHRKCSIAPKIIELDPKLELEHPLHVK